MKISKFSGFLNKLKNDSNKELLESVYSGFRAIFENQHVTKGNHLVKTTYEIITPESAEQGDVAERGWKDEEGESMELDSFDVFEIADKLSNREEFAGKSTEFLEDYVKENPSKFIPLNTAKWLVNEGATEHSSSDFDPNGWYTSYGQQDPKTGNYENLGFHLDGYTDEEKELVYNEFKRLLSR